VVLDLLPGLHQRKVRALLGYDPAEAGGLMSPDFVSVYRQATVGEVLERAAELARRRDAVERLRMGEHRNTGVVDGLTAATVAVTSTLSLILVAVTVFGL
jgi:Mg/Co/Ni transporter MgtE